MRGTFSTLAIVWRIANPYFYSEDRWAGRILLAAVIAIELAIVGLNVLLNSWNNAFYNALQDKDWDAFVYQLGYFCVLATAFILLAVYQLYLNQWLQIRWRRWLTETYLDRWLAGRQSLPHAIAWRCGRQSRPTHRGRRQAIYRRRNSSDRIEPAERGCHAGFVCRHSVEFVGRRPAPRVRSQIRYPGLSAVGGTDLCRRGNDFYASHRPGLDRAQLPAAALRGGFPVQSCPCAGELRANRIAERRTRRDATDCCCASATWSPTGWRSCRGRKSLPF